MNIFTRTACLGGWVTQAKFGLKHNYYNQQKVRVDLFNDFVSGKTNRPPMKDNINNWLKREDMSGIYLQTEELLWIKFNKKPDLFIIDNYSELVDKRFNHPDGWSFCGLYGEFKPEFIGSLLDEGLLDNVYDSYDSFFNYIKNKWNVPIIFIHFPTTFDTRAKYINQGHKITEAMEVLDKKI